MFGLLVLLFTVIPALEIYLLITIGGIIGGLNTILVVVLTGIFGAALAKTQGLAIIYHVQKDLAEGKIPTDQIFHGLLVFGGGLLLLTPGFLTDALGFLMVVPGSRHLIVLQMKAWFKKAVASGNIHFASFGQSKAGGFQSYTFYSSSDFHSKPNSQDQIDPHNTIEAEFKEKE
jgi:UPF0716 protein FxsA